MAVAVVVVVGWWLLAVLVAGGWLVAGLVAGGWLVAGQGVKLLVSIYPFKSL